MKKPNILILQGEDTGRFQGCYGNPIARTPAIDQLAAEGVRYSLGISTAPVCAPSRSAMVTGQTAWSIGSHHMRSTLLDPPRLFTHELRDAGYHVNWHTKEDFNFDPPPDFADERRNWFDDLAAGKYKDKPWLLYINFFETHESGMWADKYRETILPRLSREELCDPEQVEVPPYLPDTDVTRREIARNMDALTLQDKGVARALAALDASGERDNTLVIYLSDHGRGQVREKRWCYEAGIHLPLIVRWPDVLPAGATDDQLVSWLDIAPTLLAAAGVEIPETYQGRVFAGPAVSTPPRETCIAGRDRMDEAFDRVRALRSRKYLYIRNFYPEIPYAQRNRYMETQQTTRILREHWAQNRLTPAQSLWFAPTKPAEELYDCEADPHNVQNLAADSAFADILRQHRDALAEELARTGDFGERPERELIRQGLVKNRLDDEYALRIQPLPKRWRVVPGPTLLEAPNP